MIRFRFIEKIPPQLRNKYVITLIIFALWILLLDSNNLISRYGEIKNLKKLRTEKEYLTNKIEEDQKKLRELKTDERSLEKFAREQYRMKKQGEDLYIVLTPQEDRKIRRKTN